MKTAISAGIKLAEPSGIVALGVNKLMPWDKVKNYAQDSMRNYGDPLRTFGENLTKAEEDQMAQDQADYLAALEEAELQVDSDEKLAGLPSSERKVVSHVVVALNLGLQGVAEEGSHHISRPSPYII